MMRYQQQLFIVRFVGFLTIVNAAFSFLLVPEELPSVLSIFYSNVPPIKKGTDSRVGLGFRLGPNADFQVQFELGPQTNTQPIGPNAGTPSKKRQTANSKINRNKIVNTAKNDGKWINSWQQNLDNKQTEEENEVETRPLLYPLDPTRENNHLVVHLRQLYEKSKANDENNNIINNNNSSNNSNNNINNNASDNSETFVNFR